KFQRKNSSYRYIEKVQKLSDKTIPLITYVARMKSDLYKSSDILFQNLWMEIIRAQRDSCSLSEHLTLLVINQLQKTSGLEIIILFNGKGEYEMVTSLTRLIESISDISAHMSSSFTSTPNSLAKCFTNESFAMSLCSWAFINIIISICKSLLIDGAGFSHWLRMHRKDRFLSKERLSADNYNKLHVSAEKSEDPYYFTIVVVVPDIADEQKQLNKRGIRITGVRVEIYYLKGTKAVMAHLNNFRSLNNFTENLKLVSIYMMRNKRRLMYIRCIYYKPRSQANTARILEYLPDTTKRLINFVCGTTTIGEAIHMHQPGTAFAIF
ncbi:Hypothetical predicted protein, partial [Paramuricea clavata]